MATVDKLCREGLLQKVSPEDVLASYELPERQIYVVKSAMPWFKNTLPQLRTDGYFSGANTPMEQVANAFRDFVSGKPPEMFEMPPVRLRPGTVGVWELRTPDVRLFGVFHRPNVYILTCAKTKAQAAKKGNSGYKDAINDTLREVGELPLQPPKIRLGDLRDVITI